MTNGHMIADQPEAAGAFRSRALLIEADDAYRVTIAACMRLAGCRVEHVATPALAYPTFERGRFDLVVWGVAPGVDCRSEVISELRLRTEAPLILIDDVIEMAQLDL